MDGVNASLALAATHLVPLADLDKNKVTPGLLGFVIFALLGAATWFLMKNMNKQFGKVNFTEEPDPAASETAAPSGTAGDRTSASSASSAKSDAQG